MDKVSDVVKEFVIDERLESVIAPLTESQKAGLRQSIQTRGCIDPIKVWGEIVWDGTECYRICKELDTDYDVKYVEFSNIAEAARERIRHHQNRRQMNVVNRIESALDLFEGELAEKAKGNQLRGARNGGLSKAGNDESSLEENDKTWVNSLIAELAETNSAYVSHIRNLRKDAANNVPGAKEKLFKLRRGEVGISSSMKSAKSNTSNDSNKRKPKSNPLQKTLIEQYDNDKWGMEFALKEMNYENLKERFADNDQQEDIISPDNIFEKIAPYCKEDKSYDLVALLVPLLEICYRIGFIKGSKEQSEDGIRAEFGNREFQLHSQLRQWMQFQDDENEVKGNAVE